MRLRSARGRWVGSLTFLVPALATLAFAAAPAQAADDTAPDEEEPTEYRFEFGLTAGAHFFASQSNLGLFENDPADLSPKTNLAFGPRLALNFNRWLAFEVEGLWIPTHTVRNPDGTTLNVFAYRGSL